MQKLTSPFELIKKAVGIFAKKENFVYLIKIYAPLVVFSVVSIIQRYLPSSTTGLVWVTVIFAVLQILYVLTYTFVSFAGVIAVSGVVKGDTLSIKSVYQKVWNKYWLFVLFCIVLFLIQALGFVLLIIPGILFMVWFAFSKFIFIESNVGIKSALVKSKELAKGRFWQLLGRLVVFGLFAAISQIILSVFPYGIGTVLTDLAGGLFVLPLYLLYKEISA